MTDKNNVKRSPQTPHKLTHAEICRRKGIFAKDMTNTNILMVVLTVLANITLVYTMLNTTQFSNLSKTAFLLVNIVALLILLVGNVLVLIGIRSRKKTLYITAMVLVCVFLAIGSVGSYMLIRVNSSIGKITSTTTETSVSTSLVVYSDTGTQTISEASQLDGGLVGFATGTSTADLGKKELDSKGINVTYKEYQDYTSLALGLFGGEIECAILPSNYESMLSSESSLSDYIANTASILDFDSTVTVENSSGSDKDLTTEPFTVLLIGNADGLSDTIILCSVNPISMKITMTSIARDSYVPITCYNNSSSKINAAHAVSRDCLLNTVEQLVGVDIDYYIDTNFQGVVDVVDALGGIVVNNSVEFVGQTASSERGTKTVWVPAGDNVLLNGAQALAFARERYAFASGDFARQGNQQQVIKAILRSIMRTRDVNTFLNVFEAAGDNIQTNFTIAQMTSFVKYAMQKVNRYHDQEHVENVFNIVSSRVTGYSSNIWNEGTQSSLYIYRLYEGSLSDTKTAIQRNINLDTSITEPTDVKWSVNWDFTVPDISQEYYAEAQIIDEVPTNLGNYVGKALSALTSWASSHGITINATDGNGNTVTSGTITSQDVAEGTNIDSISVINVVVAASAKTYEDPGNCDGTWDKTKGTCTCTNGGKYDSTKGCVVATPTPAATAAPTSVPTAVPTSTPPDTNTAEGCAAASKFWYGGTCYATQAEADLAAKKADCSTKNGTWDEDLKTCTFADPGNCEGTWSTTDGTCTCTNGGKYDSTNGCVAQ